MNHTVMQIYRFRPIPGVQESDLLRQSAAVDRLLLGAEGFLYRTLARVDAQQWQDVVYWKDNEAHAAVEPLMADEAFEAWMDMLDLDTVVATKATVVSHICPSKQPLRA